MKSVEINKNKDLTLNQEYYVEAIADLIEQHGHAHPADIARLMNVRKPSVTEAVNRLVDMGIATRADHEVSLTGRGTRIAKDLSRRHNSLRDFMVYVLDMSEENADVAACNMEHAVDSDFIDRLLLLCDFMKNISRNGCRQQWRDMIETFGR